MSDSLSILQSRVALTDPHVVNDDADSLNLLNSLYEPLASRVGDSFAPRLASSWEATEEARSWEFTLRADVRFHDGTVMGPEDVVASLDRARSPDTGGVLGTEGLFHSYLGDASTTIPNRRTVRIVTSEPMADLLDLIASIPILPARRQGEPANSPVGSGPFRLHAASDGHAVLTAHEGYWKPNAPASSRVIWRAEPDADARLRMAMSGEADLVTSVPQELAAAAGAAERIQLRTAPSNVCTVFMCNLLRGPCADPAVRQALNYGFDQAEVIRAVTGGSALPLAGPLTVKHAGYDANVQPYAYDPGKARDLLDRHRGDVSLPLILDVPEKLPDEAVQVAELLAEQYVRIGIDTEIAIHSDRSAYAQMVKSKRMRDACCFDSSPLSTFRALREKFHSGLQGPWWLGYSNKRLDEILDAAQREVDAPSRKGLYQGAYRVLHRDAPWIYLYNQMDRWCVSDRLRDWQPTVDGLISLA